MRRRDAIVGLLASALIVLALLAVFAVELSNTQARSKRDVEARVHERAVLAAALLSSLFQSAEQQVPQDVRSYGAPVVSAATMNRNQGRNTSLALLDSRGDVLAHSRGFTQQASSDLRISAALALIRSGHPYGLGNVLPYGTTGVIDFAVAFPTRYGSRILLTGFRPDQLSGFIAGELRQIPGVKGANNYLLDGNRVVLASTNPARPAGYVFRSASQVKALARPSGDVTGHYYDQVALSNSTWKVVLAAPDGPLFASATGLRKWVPWLIFIAFALVALVAFVLALRALRSADEAHDAKARLERVNVELEAANGALRRHARELARSNAELDQFASIASHDLQEPLRKVRTFTQQLTVIEAKSLSPKGRDYAQRANAAAERMQKLIEDLLKFSRVGTHGRPFGPMDLAEVTREVVGDLEVQIELSGAHVRIGELPTISADALQMRQLMQNLISNSLKFKRPDVSPEIVIDAAVTRTQVEISVRDNGIGFDPQYSRRIFRVFERLHGRSDYPGTGIGLALCRKIAERHSGSIVADSEPGVGSTFIVTLPLRQPNEEKIVIPNLADELPREEIEEHVPA